MRLIDADDLLKNINNYCYDTKDDVARRMEHVTKTQILELIDRQPTAYDIDKVVERLEDYLFDKYCVEGDAKIEETVKVGMVNKNR